MVSEAERIISLYQRHADDGDRERERSLFEKPWLVISPHPAWSFHSRHRMWFCGANCRYFIEKGCDVTGADSSPTLIGICKVRFPNLDWLVTDMRKLSLSRHFDAILAWDSFFHLCPEDQRGMFPIFRRIAAPRAALMFTSGSSRGEAIGVYKDEPLYHGSLDGAEYRSLLNQNGFDVVSHVVEDPACGCRTVWLAQLK